MVAPGRYAAPLLMLGGALWLKTARVDGRLVAAVLTGFAGVALVLRPTFEHDLVGPGMVGLAGGLVGATAFLQIAALGRAGEPEERIVFSFAFGVLLFDDPVTWMALAGMMLIFAAGIAATFLRSHAARSEPI